MKYLEYSAIIIVVIAVMVCSTIYGYNNGSKNAITCCCELGLDKG